LTRITYKASVTRDLKRLDRTRAESLIRQLAETLNRDADSGVPLKGEFKGLYKLRIGDYRVIYAKTEKETVIVLRIGHRSKVYRD
jgi:mRNA interferase RelE/StbE